MNRKLQLLITLGIAALTLAPPPCSAATTNISVSASEPIARISGFDRILHSIILDQDRPFSVFLPQGYETSVHRYPVLFVLDGGAYDSYIAETVKLLAFQREIPPLIIVGIPSINRTHDLTPIRLPDEPGTGGGEKFLKFLKSELVPFIDQNYRTEDMHILFGHSLGGSFTVYSIITEPTLFQAGLAISPALYSDRGRLLRLLETTLQSNPTFPTRFLYMTIGNELGYKESLDFLKDQLQQFPPSGLRWESQEFLEETHASIVMHTLVLSLKALFFNWPLQVSELQEGFEAVASHYEEASATLGFQVKIPENLVNGLGYEAIASGDLFRAKLILKYNVRHYPTSSNAHDSLAEAHFKEGNLEKALAGYQKSFSLNPGNNNAKAMIEQIRGLK